MQQLPKRLLSIDALRAITMFLMIFVNDASGIANLPAWIDHAKETEDLLGFADIIFPAFLFIVGLSLPFAINARIKKGYTTGQVITYILTRSVALIIMGFYHVNLESFSNTAIIPRAVWALIVTTSFFLIWLDYPQTISKVKKNTLIGLGFLLLIIMACLYKGGDDMVPRGMRPSWWGILGIIGWANLICALLFYVVNGKLNWLIGLWVVFVAVNILSHLHLLPYKKLFLIGDGSSVMLVMGGITLSGIFARLVTLGKTQIVWYLFPVIGVCLIIGGLLIRPYTEGISKIHSTPAWIFICSGITTVVFTLLIYVVDMKGYTNLFSWIRPAGTSTLTCYLIPYFQVYLMYLFHIEYPAYFNSGIGGIIRSIVTCFVIIWLVGVMEKKNIRLKINPAIK